MARTIDMTPRRLFDFDMIQQGTQENPFLVSDNTIYTSEFEDTEEEDFQWYLKGTSGVIFPEGEIN